MPRNDRTKNEHQNDEEQRSSLAQQLPPILRLALPTLLLLLPTPVHPLLLSLRMFEEHITSKKCLKQVIGVEKVFLLVVLPVLLLVAFFAAGLVVDSLLVWV